MGELRTIARQPDGPEWRRIIEVPNPGAGSDIAVPVEGKRAWRVLSLLTTFTASIAAGNRDLVFSVSDASQNNVIEIQHTTAITAGLTREVGWYAGLGAVVVGAGTLVALPLPAPLYAFPGETINVFGLTDGGDRYRFTRLVVIETYIGEAVAERNREQAIYDHWSALHNLITLGEP